MNQLPRHLQEDNRTLQFLAERMKPQRWNVNIFKETQRSSIWLFYQIYKTVQCYFFLSKFQLYSLLLCDVIKQPTQASCALYSWPTLLPNCDLHSQTSGNSTHSANWLSMFSNCPTRTGPGPQSHHLHLLIRLWD